MPLSAAGVVALLLMAALEMPAATASGIYIGPSELPWAVVEKPYAFSLTISGGARCWINNMSVSLADGQLPDGIQLDVIGQFRGAPRKTGTYRFVVRAANSCGDALKSFTVLVAATPALSASPRILRFRYRQGEELPPSQAVHVDGSWPNLPYSVATDAKVWVTTAPKTGRTPNPESGRDAELVEVTVQPQTLPPGKYEAVLRFSTWEGGLGPAVAIILTVEPSEVESATKNQCPQCCSAHEHGETSRE